MNNWFSDGATAEYCITQPSSIAQKPTGLTHIEAASVPIGALTAWQGLFDRARLQAPSAAAALAQRYQPVVQVRFSHDAICARR